MKFFLQNLTNASSSKFVCISRSIINCIFIKVKVCFKIVMQIIIFIHDLCFHRGSWTKAKIMYENYCVNSIFSDDPHMMISRHICAKLIG
ncbi:hypothetical protein [Spodoptera cosmioides nucleopolyhedrovirus]|uniref:Uncharacterized protein n=1 Tax=Spodoptera cosmioides nucleopolyhedrovirus TaxID=2605774 RepID=A0A6B7KIB1_9ABAC|nr:hypothetical protein [Spodoptera cosmioides nucleopolyhedrovirus]